MLQVEQSIATPLEHLEFVVQSCHKAAAFPVGKVVDNFLSPAAQGVDELIETAQPASGEAFDPDPDFGFGICRGDVLIKNFCQLLLEFTLELCMPLQLIMRRLDDLCIRHVCQGEAELHGFLARR